MLASSSSRCTAPRHQRRSCSAWAPLVHTTRALRTKAAAQLRGDEPATPSQWASQLAGSALLAVSLLLSAPGTAHARLEGVNRPELLPKGEVANVIDVAGWLAPSEEERLKREIDSLEKDTGFKLRVLAQTYPETPGLAVRDYWGVDDNTIVFVADTTFSNLINVNVGQNVDLEVPRSFWSRLAGTYGNKFSVKENGEADSIINTVSAIDTCLREPQGRSKCATVQARFGEQDSSGPIGKLFGQ